jgi:glycosyltransferase involved in cell wall biosynthesis
VGKGGDQFAALFCQQNPTLHGQVHATGCLSPEQVAAHLAACDCLVQPFVDGVSSRRTSVMAGLALGAPIVTNRGPLTDSVWNNTNAVVLSRSSSSSEFLEAVERLLAESGIWKGLGHRAGGFYQEHFALVRTIHALRDNASHSRLSL